MNKSDLIRAIHNNELLSKNDVEDSLNIILECLSSSLSERNRIEIRGFGSFSIRERKERIARNPKTGKSISVATKFHPHFRASKSLKEAINN